MQQSQNSFWGILGKFTGLISALWILIQFYNTFIEKDYNIEANGEYSNFEVPDSYIKKLEDYERIIVLDSKYKDNVNPAGASLEKVRTEYEKADPNSPFKLYTDLEIQSNRIIAPYSSVWSIEIENSGNKPLEILSLETAFDEGFYHLIKADTIPVSGEFEKKIKLGNLNPGQSVSVRFWTNETLYYPERAEEQTRLIHKFGVEDIDFPVLATGFFAWDIKNHYIGSIMGMLTIVFIFFHLGYKMYPANEKMEKERRLKEIEEQEKLKKELEKTEK